MNWLQFAFLYSKRGKKFIVITSDLPVPVHKYGPVYLGGSLVDAQRDICKYEVAYETIIFFT